MAIAESQNVLDQIPKAPRPSRWKKLRENLSVVSESRVATFGMILVLVWVVLGFVSLFWTPYPPNSSLFIQNLPPFSSNELGGINILGTDHLGRDLLARLMTGTQVILLKTRLPEATGTQYMSAFTSIAILVSLTSFFSILSTAYGKRAKQNILLLAGGWLLVSVILFFILRNVLPNWVLFGGTFGVIYLATFVYGWIRAKTLGVTDKMKTWSISLAIAVAFWLASLFLIDTVIPGFSIPIGVAIWGVIGSLTLGSILGLNAGYRGGWWDQVIMQFLDALIAFPRIVLYLVVISALGQGDLVMILAITITGAPGVARLVRGLGLDIKTRDYIRAAETRGESVQYIMFREILPNARGPILVDAMLRVGYAIFAIGTLGFLGIGLPPPDPDWGNMVNDARQFIFTNQWAVIWPALAIASLVVGLNFFADGLREELTRYQK